MRFFRRISLTSLYTSSIVTSSLVATPVRLSTPKKDGTLVGFAREKVENPLYAFYFDKCRDVLLSLSIVDFSEKTEDTIEFSIVKPEKIDDLFFDFFFYFHFGSVFLVYGFCDDHGDRFNNV